MENAYEERDEYLATAREAASQDQKGVQNVSARESFCVLRCACWDGGVPRLTKGQLRCAWEQREQSKITQILIIAEGVLFTALHSFLAALNFLLR